MHLKFVVAPNINSLHFGGYLYILFIFFTSAKECWCVRFIFVNLVPDVACRLFLFSKAARDLCSTVVIEIHVDILNIVVADIRARHTSRWHHGATK